MSEFVFLAFDNNYEYFLKIFVQQLLSFNNQTLINFEIFVEKYSQFNPLVPKTISF
jgi:hypothetical protein